MADTGKQSPLGVNIDGNFLQNKGLCINAKVPTYVGISKTNDSYQFATDGVNLNATTPVTSRRDSGSNVTPTTGAGSDPACLPTNCQSGPATILTLQDNLFPVPGAYRYRLGDLSTDSVISIEIPPFLGYNPAELPNPSTNRPIIGGTVDISPNPGSVPPSNVIIKISNCPGDVSAPTIPIQGYVETLGGYGGIRFSYVFPVPTYGGQYIDPTKKVYFNFLIPSSASAPGDNYGFYIDISTQWGNEGEPQVGVDVAAYNCNNSSSGTVTCPTFNGTKYTWEGGQIRDIPMVPNNVIAVEIDSKKWGIGEYSISWVPPSSVSLTGIVKASASPCPGVINTASNCVGMPAPNGVGSFRVVVGRVLTSREQNLGYCNISSLPADGIFYANFEVVEPGISGTTINVNVSPNPDTSSPGTSNCSTRPVAIDWDIDNPPNPPPPSSPVPRFTNNRAYILNLKNGEIAAIKFPATRYGKTQCLMTINVDDSPFYSPDGFEAVISECKGGAWGETPPGNSTTIWTDPNKPGDIYTQASASIIGVQAGLLTNTTGITQSGGVIIPVCKIDPNKSYYLNIRWKNSTGDTCTHGEGCGGYVDFAYQDETSTDGPSVGTSAPGNYCTVQPVEPQNIYRFFSSDADPVGSGRVRKNNLKQNKPATFIIPPFAGRPPPNTRAIYGFDIDWIAYGGFLDKFTITINECQGDTTNTPPGQRRELFHLDDPNPISGVLSFRYVEATGATAANTGYVDPTKTYYVNIMPIDGDPDPDGNYGISISCQQINGPEGACQPGYDCPGYTVPGSPKAGAGTGDLYRTINLENPSVYSTGEILSNGGRLTITDGQVGKILAIKLPKNLPELYTSSTQVTSTGARKKAIEIQFNFTSPVPGSPGVSQGTYSISETPGNMTTNLRNATGTFRPNGYGAFSIQYPQLGVLNFPTTSDTQLSTGKDYYINLLYTQASGNPYSIYVDINVTRRQTEQDVLTEGTRPDPNPTPGSPGPGAPDPGGTSYSGRLGRLVQDTSLRLQVWGINDAFWRNKVTPANYDRLIYIGSDINGYVVPGNPSFQTYGSCTIPALGNAKPPTYIPYDPAGKWNRQLSIHSPAPASTAWPFAGFVGQTQGASWFPYSSSSVNKSITQWGYFRLHALQAWNEFKYNGSDVTSYPPQYKDFCASFMTADAWMNYNNQAIYAQDNSKTFLKGVYSGMNNLVTGDIAGVCSGNFQAFGQDLTNLGRAINLKTIKKFGYPSNLLQILIQNNALTQDMSLSLEAVGINQSLIQQVYNSLDPSFTPEQERLIYSAFLIMRGANLLPILNLLNCVTANIDSLADLLSVKKLFPSSYTNIAIEIFNSSVSGTTGINNSGAKLPFLIYNGTSINSTVSDLDVGYQITPGEPQPGTPQTDTNNYGLPQNKLGSLLESIIPSEDAVAAGAFAQSMSQVRNIDQVNIETFAQIVGSLENAINSDTPLVNGTPTLPVDLPSANQGHYICGSGTGQQGTFRMSDLFGNMSGLPYNYPEIFRLLNQLAPPPPDGTTHSGYSAVFYVYQQNFLAITWDKAHHTLQQPTGNIVINVYKPPEPHSTEDPAIIGMYSIVTDLGGLDQAQWNEIAGTATSSGAGKVLNLQEITVGSVITPVTNLNPEPPVAPGTISKLFYDPITGKYMPEIPARYKLYYDVRIQLVNKGGGYGRGQAPVPKVRIYPEEFNIGFSDSKVTDVIIGRDDLLARSQGGGTYGRITRTTIDNGKRVFYYIPENDVPRKNPNPIYSINVASVPYIEIYSDTPPNQNICDPNAQFKPRALYITTEAPPTDILPVTIGTEQYPLGTVTPVGTNKPGDVYWHCGKFQENTPGWPNPMNDVVGAYINQANSVIRTIYNTRTGTNTDPVTSLNLYYEQCGVGLMVEQRTRYFALVPVEVPYNDFANPYPVTIHSFVDSLPSMQQDTAPHMTNQTLEHISDINGYNSFLGNDSGKVGGQSVVAMGRQERNQSRLQIAGISLDNNIRNAPTNNQLALLTMNGVIAGAVTGIDNGTATYTYPSWPGTIDDGGEPIYPVPSGRWISGPGNGTGTQPGEITDYFVGGEFPQVGPIVVIGAENAGPDTLLPPGTPDTPQVPTEFPPGSRGPTEPTTGFSGVATGGRGTSTGFNNVVSGTGYKSILPPNLDATFTNSTLLPSNYSVQEAIDRVVQCNCDCFVT